MLAAETIAALSDLSESPKTNPSRSWNQIVEQVDPFLQSVHQRLIQQTQQFDPQLVPYAQSA